MGQDKRKGRNKLTLASVRGYDTENDMEGEQTRNRREERKLAYFRRYARVDDVMSNHTTRLRRFPDTQSHPTVRIHGQIKIEAHPSSFISDGRTLRSCAFRLWNPATAAPPTWVRGTE
jgi:hypothetical protein